MRIRQRRKTSSITLLAGLASLLALPVFMTACANGEFRPKDPWDRQLTLEEKHKDYTDYVRWSKFDEAAAFVASDERTAFRRAMPDFAEMRFTDWDAAPWELDEELRETEIKVTYKGYSLSSPIEVKIIEIQKWSREGKRNAWSVRSSFAGIDRLAER